MVRARPVSREGRGGGGTYAHEDIAFEFGTWLSPEFKLYLIKEFQRLKRRKRGAHLWIGILTGHWLNSTTAPIPTLSILR